MKTTLEIPDPVFRRAKARAAEEGIPFRQFVTDAVEERLGKKAASRREDLLKLGGGLRHLRAETKRIDALIEDEFEKIDPEMWT